MVALGSLAEPVSSLTHFLGALLIFAGALRLFLQVRHDFVRARAVALYGAGVCGMFLASGTYHALAFEHPWRSFFRYLDHAMIWAAIVSTIAAIQVLARVGSRKAVLAVWGAGLAGVGAEALTLNGLAPWVSPLLYVAMGWVGFVPFLSLVRQRGFAFGLTHSHGRSHATLGGAADATEWPMIAPRVVEAHEVMHVLILVGMLLFLWAVTRCAGIEGAGIESGTEPDAS